MLYIVPKPFL